MITVILKGGLGNMLFQYALGKQIAINSSSKLVLDLSNYRNPQRRIDELRFIGIDEKFILPTLRQRLATWFRSNPHLFPEHNLRSSEVLNLIKKVRRENSVSVHVRRGDYVNSKLHSVCDKRYYLNAISTIQEQIPHPKFYFFSDDIAWCRNELGVDSAVYIDFEVEHKRAVELILMKNCRNHIISNSSFSWWAAWLNPIPEKLVVSPNRWFNQQDMSATAMCELVLSEWMQVGTD